MRRGGRSGRALPGLVLLVLLWGASSGLPQESDWSTQALVTTAGTPAPEFPAGLAWVNRAQPLSLRALRGKVVLLDFWTAGCINCLHVQPLLRRLETAFADVLVVIGVHTPKYPHEATLHSVQQAVARYGIRHPVVNDPHWQLWQAYRVPGWPTLVVIDPEGRILQGFVGENHDQRLERLIAATVAYHRRKGTLRPGAAPAVALPPPAATALRYPGKVLADAASSRLFIADSGHHRLVVTDLEGRLLAVVGSGQPGAEDGPLATATFRAPQGLALDGEVLYVADTGNHLLRRVDLQQGTVTTLAGTGAKALAWNVPGAARRTPLNSPWDLFLQGDSLYIAMAGMHQIWRLHLPTGWLEPFAGTGEEGLRDGERSEALLAQPSGLSGDGARLYVADTEANAVRRIGLAPSGEVTTLAGGGLFTFGDRDGSGREARLQHPLGLAYADGRLYVADTYNYKLKVLDLSRGRLTTLAGSGTSGSRDGAAEQAQFDEPGGLSAAGDRLYVADTNNHRVRVVDLKAGTVRTLALPALAPPAPTLAPAATVIRVAEQALPVATPVILQLRPQLPAGWKLNPEAPATLAVEVRGDAAEVPVAYRQQTLQPLQLPLEVPLQVQRAAARAVVSLALRLVLCQTQAGGICALRQVAWEVPVVGKATATATTVPLAVVLP